MSRRITSWFLCGCALVACLDARAAWSVLARSLSADPYPAGELVRADANERRKPVPTSTPDRSLPRRPVSVPASVPSGPRVARAPRESRMQLARLASRIEAVRDDAVAPAEREAVVFESSSATR